MDTRQEARMQAALLGTLILHGNYAATVFDTTTVADFYCYPKIAGVLKAAYDAGKSIDYLTISAQLNGDAKTLDDLLPEAENVIPTAVKVAEWARRVALEGRRLRRRGAMVKGIDRIAAACDGDDLDRAEAEIIESLIERGQASGAVEDVGDVGARVLDHIALWNANPGQTWGLSTGYAALDNTLGGLENTSLYVLAARPSMGKTSLGLGIANNVASDGKAVLYISPEMSNEQLYLRLLCMRGLIDSRELKRGRADEALVYDQMDRMKSRLAGKFFVNDRSGITSAEARALAAEAKRRHDIALVVFDYMNLASDIAENANKRLGNVAKGLKELAKAVDIPVLALTQLNRAVESRDSKIPTLADLRDSGEIEESADVVMFVHRAAYYLRDKPAQILELQNAKRDKIADIVVAKNRNGAIGRCELVFDEVHTLFGDVANGLEQH